MPDTSKRGRPLIEVLNTFSVRLTELREAANLTRNALAVRAGLSPIQISRFESGAYGPTLATAAKLAAALGCGLEAFNGCDWPEK